MFSLRGSDKTERFGQGATDNYYVRSNIQFSARRKAEQNPIRVWISAQRRSRRCSRIILTNLEMNSRAFLPCKTNKLQAECKRSRICFIKIFLKMFATARSEHIKRELNPLHARLADFDVQWDRQTMCSAVVEGGRMLNAWVLGARLRIS